MRRGRTGTGPRKIGDERRKRLGFYLVNNPLESFIVNRSKHVEVHPNTYKYMKIQVKFKHDFLSEYPHLSPLVRV